MDTQPAELNSRPFCAYPPPSKTEKDARMVDRMLDAVEREELHAIGKRIGWTWLVVGERCGLSMAHILAVYKGKRAFDVSRLAYLRRAAVALEGVALRTTEDDMDEPTMAERLKDPVEIGRGPMHVSGAAGSDAPAQLEPEATSHPVAADTGGAPLTAIIEALADLYVEQMDNIEGEVRDATEEAYSRVAERLGISDHVAHAIRQRLPVPVPLSPIEAVVAIGRRDAAFSPTRQRIAGAASLPPG